MAIDVGRYNTSGSSGSGGYTVINKDNAANATGTIDHIDINVNGADNYEVASFTDEGSSNYSTNGAVTVACANGENSLDAPGDFTAFAITLGEYIGLYPDAVKRESYGNGSAYLAGDQIPCSSAGFTEPYSNSYALYGTGVESGGSENSMYYIQNQAGGCQ